MTSRREHDTKSKVVNNNQKKKEKERARVSLNFFLSSFLPWSFSPERLFFGSWCRRPIHRDGRAKAENYTDYTISLL